MSGTNLSLHPNLIPKYLSALRDFQKLLDGHDAAELRSTFRHRIEAVVVHPTVKRGDYDVEVRGWETAWIGGQTAPRSNQEILEKEGLSACGSIGIAKLAEGTPHRTNARPHLRWRPSTI